MYETMTKLRRTDQDIADKDNISHKLSNFVDSRIALKKRKS